MLVKGLIFGLVIILTSADPDPDPNVIVKVDVNVDVDGCCPEYQCKDGVNGKCRKECRGDETNSMVGCDAKNGDDCNLKCCIETEEGCWNPITKMWVKNGTIVDFGGCTCEICINGIWEPHPDVILRRCPKCNVFGEPHIQAFTEAMCAWQVPCNHALTQEGFSRKPAFGVFNDFKDRGTITDDIAIVGPTTYKEEHQPDVIVDTASHVVTVRVGAAGHVVPLTTTPTLLGGTTVWAWMKNGCIKLYGKHKMLIKLCSWDITIWTPRWMQPVWPSWPGGYPLVGGLCSSNDLKSKWEKLVARNQAVFLSPGINHLCDTYFGIPWQASHQTKSTCPATQPKSGPIQKICSHSQGQANLVHICRAIVDASMLTGSEYAMYYEACLFDLCATHKLGNITVIEMIEAYEQMTVEAKIEQDNTIDCCQDTSCTVHNGTCVLKHGNPFCNPTLCSGDDCTCCP